MLMDEAIRRAGEALSEMVELARNGLASCAELQREGRSLAVAART